MNDRGKAALDAYLTSPSEDVCMAFSPDARFQCDMEVDHKGNHIFHGSGALWETLLVGGELVPMEMVLTLAQWPQRDSDFDDEGMPVKPKVDA